jgi:hypothetical protein
MSSFMDIKRDLEMDGLV